MAKGEARLGKGLGALLGEYLEAGEAAERNLEIGRIRPNPFQPRKEFPEEALEELAASIRQNGLLQPLVVRPAAEGKAWELVAGERRLRALKRLGRETAPALVRELSDRQMLVLALVENLQRENLSPLEEAVGYRRLVEDFGLTQKEVAERVGRDRSTVANTLRLLSLPEAVQEMVAGGALTAGHARAILGLEDARGQVRLAREVAEAGLSVRETERRVRRLRGGSPQADEADREGEEGADGRKAGRADPAVRRAEKVLQRALGTQVRVRVAAEGRGEIRIPFHGPDDFERLLGLLAGEAAGEVLDGA